MILPLIIKILKNRYNYTSKTLQTLFKGQKRQKTLKNTKKR